MVVLSPQKSNACRSKYVKFNHFCIKTTKDTKALKETAFPQYPALPEAFPCCPLDFQKVHKISRLSGNDDEEDNEYDEDEDEDNDDCCCHGEQFLQISQSHRTWNQHKSPI